MILRNQKKLPPAHGLYCPSQERDSCGIGFVANIKGEYSHQIICDADRLLNQMDHRGARGSEVNTGDGAGILTALPYEFLTRVARDDLGQRLPEPNKVGSGIVFLPTDDVQRNKCKNTVEAICVEEGQKILGWRLVPTEAKLARLGATAREAAPRIEQIFIAASEDLEGDAPTGHHPAHL